MEMRSSRVEITVCDRHSGESRRRCQINGLRLETGYRWIETYWKHIWVKLSEEKDVHTTGRFDFRDGSSDEGEDEWKKKG